MSLEQQLRETMRRVADGVRPDAARAYDRFRRRRLRRMVLIPVVAAMVFALAIATTVAVAQRLPDPAEPVQPAPTPTPAPTPSRQTPAPFARQSQPLPPLEYQPGPRTVDVPAMGVSIDVPDGWLFTDLVDQGPDRDWLHPPGHELVLRPESGPPAEIHVSTTVIRADIGPGKGEVYPATTHLPDEGQNIPQGPYEYSRRPDGRRVLQGANGYYVTWPYHCAPDVECRTLTKLRTLFVQFAPGTAMAAVRAVGEALVRDARPITNALPGGARSAPREPCPAQIMRGGGGGTSDVETIEVELGYPRPNACRFHAEVSLDVVANGELARVDGNETVVLEGDLPEGGLDPDGHFRVAWRWTNWCGPPSVQARVVVNGVANQRHTQVFGPPVPPKDRWEPRTRGTAAPRCVDPSRPSTVQVVAAEP